MIKHLTLAATAIAITAGAAAAQTPTRLEQFQAWGVYKYDTGGKSACFALSKPVTQEPRSVNHGDNWFFVYKRPEANVNLEPEVRAGYNLKGDAAVQVTVDDKTFDFNPNDASAWMKNAAQEPDFVAAAKRGRNMVVNATSKRGTNTKYTYSLMGITAALKAVTDC